MTSTLIDKAAYERMPSDWAGVVRRFERVIISEMPKLQRVNIVLHPRTLNDLKGGLRYVPNLVAPSGGDDTWEIFPGVRFRLSSDHAVSVGVIHLGMGVSP